MMSYEEEVSGYDLKKWIDWSVDLYYWSPSYSQIYTELKRLESLGLAIQANQDAACEIANGFGLAVFDEERIKRFWFAVKTEMEFAAGLACGWRGDENRTAQGHRQRENSRNTAYHCVTSCDGRTS